MLETDKEQNNLIEDHVVMHVLGVILAIQYSIQKGIKLFGDQGNQSVTSELQLLHDVITFIPVHAQDLSKSPRTQALASLMFMTEKRCKHVKKQSMHKWQQTVTMDKKGRHSIPHCDGR